MSDGQVSGIRLEKMTVGGERERESSAFRGRLVQKNKSHTWETEAKKKKKNQSV